MIEPQDSLVSDKPPLTSFILILAVVFIGFVVIGPLIGGALAMPIYDGDFLSDLSAGTLHPDSFFPLILVQGTVSFIGLIALPMLYIRYAEGRPIHRFFKRENNLLLTSIIICSTVIVFVVALSPIAEWNMNVEFPESLKSLGDWMRQQEDQNAEMTKILTDFKSFDTFLWGLLVIAAIAAVGEEFVFRGLLQNELFRSSGNIHAAIWVSAILFSSFHLQFFGFFPRMLLGALFGYLYYWSGNLWVPIIGHFFNNGFLLTMFYLHSIGVSQVNMEEETAAPLYLVGVCAVAFFTLLYFFKKQYSSPPNNS